MRWNINNSKILIPPCLLALLHPIQPAIILGHRDQHLLPPVIQRNRIRGRNSQKRPIWPKLSLGQFRFLGAAFKVEDLCEGDGTFFVLDAGSE